VERDDWKAKHAEADKRATELQGRVEAVEGTPEFRAKRIAELQSQRDSAAKAAEAAGAELAKLTTPPAPANPIPPEAPK
jgi:hypothetical protein